MYCYSFLCVSFNAVVNYGLGLSFPGPTHSPSRPTTQFYFLWWACVNFTYCPLFFHPPSLFLAHPKSTSSGKFFKIHNLRLSSPIFFPTQRSSLEQLTVGAGHESFEYLHGKKIQTFGNTTHTYWTVSNTSSCSHFTCQWNFRCTVKMTTKTQP